jgi:hypothetical protein
MCYTKCYIDATSTYEVLLCMLCMLKLLLLLRLQPFSFVFLHPLHPTLDTPYFPSFMLQMFCFLFAILFPAVLMPAY